MTSTGGSRLTISNGDYMTVIIGGGLAGLAAAYKMVENNDVLLIEKEPELGGMVSSYHINGYHIEKYYHHLFPGDKELISLIHELGLGDRLEWLRGSTGYYINGKIYPMNTPTEILKALPFMDVLRLALLVMKAKRVKDFREFDDITAEEWVVRTSGVSVYNNFFLPLLISKFGENKDKVSAAWLLGRVKIRSHRGVKGEKLGYLRGGFHMLIEAIANSIKERGGCIRHGNVSRIVVENNSVRGVIVDGEYIECNKVISTIAPHVLKEIIDLPGLENLNYQGTACVLFGLKEKIMDVYWLNIKNNVAFGAVIEHTNLIPASYYGEHLMYVTSYFQNKDSILYKLRDEELVELYLEGLEKLFKGFREKVKWWRLRRDIYTSPVYSIGYGNTILPYRTGIKGLYLAGMFSEANYPERSMNGSIKAGFRCAEVAMM